MYVSAKFLKWAFIASGMTNPNVQETFQFFCVSFGDARSVKLGHHSTFNCYV